MNDMTINPETGFLESLNQNFNTFTSAKKSKVLKVALNTVKAGKYPDKQTLCDLVGIGLRTFNAHLVQDDAFKSAWQEIKHRTESLLTDNLAKKAESKMGTLATLALLRHNESGRWNNEGQTININTQDASIKTLLNKANDYIEAEILDNPAITSTSPDQIENK